MTNIENFQKLAEDLESLIDKYGDSMYISIRGKLYIAYRAGILRFNLKGVDSYFPIVRINRDMLVSPANNDLWMMLGSYEQPYELNTLIVSHLEQYGSLVEIDAQVDLFKRSTANAQSEIKSIELSK